MSALRSTDTSCYFYRKQPLFTRLVCSNDATLVGAAPFTVEVSESEHELQVELVGQEHERARDWCHDIISKSEDISERIADALEDSWAGPPVSPELLYYKILSDYFAQALYDSDVDADSNPLLRQLTDFQREAYQYAKGILRRYGGVFLADVVGLGKTYIGMALLKHLYSVYGEAAIVVGPPNVLPAWRSLAAEYRVELQTVSIGKLEDLEALRDREVLLIDESHNFRNLGTQRYQKIQSWLRPDGGISSKRVILLSATPQNNSVDDIRNQLSFFPDTFARLPYAAESLEDFFRRIKNDRGSVRDLLQHVVVRRTRTFIKEAYPDATVRKKQEDGTYQEVPLEFPNRLAGEEQCLRYSLDKVYGSDFYQRLLEAIGRLHYAPYQLARYLTPRGQSDPRVSGIRRSGSAIRGLFKSLLLKRLESSLVAFAATLQRYEMRLIEAMRTIERSEVQVRIREPLGDDQEGFLESLRTVPTSLFQANLLEHDLGSDLDVVQVLGRQLKILSDKADAKVERLKRALRERPPERHRTIIFTQFADTADYLAAELGHDFGRTECATSSRGNALSAARRFSPSSNDYQPKEGEEIDLLISTDTLSEGINLQEADSLINYDIHWNPVRLIQRAGRIDRIGSEHSEIVVSSFLPEQGLEKELGIEAVLRRRIEEFLEVFGEDSAVLPSDEMPDMEGAYAAFSGEALEDKADAMDGLSRHYERLRRFEREHPEQYKAASEVRNGKHAYSASATPSICASRVGWHWNFRIQGVDQDGVTLEDDLDALDLLHGHAVVGEITSLVDEVRDQGYMFANTAFEEFLPIAEQIREQRRAPKLSAAEAYILESLDRYRPRAKPTQHARLQELLQLVRSGVAQRQLARLGKQWKKEGLKPAAIFEEVNRAIGGASVETEDLGRVELVGVMVGTNNSS
tara:strand:+ start:19261 stop:22008 length:2748 start_codon:yes stop_codon:yes gene_type:complete